MVDNKPWDNTPFTGGGSMGGSSPLLLEINRQAMQERDPKAQALMGHELSLGKFGEELVKLNNEKNTIRKDLEDYRKDLKRTDGFLIAVTLVVVVAFITTLSLIFFDLIKDKDLYLGYIKMQDNYNQESTNLKDQFYQQQIKMDDLENEVKILKARNPGLK